MSFGLVPLHWERSSGSAGFWSQSPVVLKCHLPDCGHTSRWALSSADFILAFTERAHAILHTRTSVCVCFFMCVYKSSYQNHQKKLLWHLDTMCFCVRVSKNKTFPYASWDCPKRYPIQLHPSNRKFIFLCYLISFGKGFSLVLAKALLHSSSTE